MPFEVKEGMEEEHAPEMDLARCQQVLEEGDKFASCKFNCLWLDLPSRKRRQVVSEQLPHHRIQCTMGGKKGRIIEDKMGRICA